MPEVLENFTMLHSAYSLDNQDTLLYEDLDTNEFNFESPSSAHDNLSAASPMSATSIPFDMSQCIQINGINDIGKPKLVILEQPVDKFRFRYKSEMIGTHGSLLGVNSLVCKSKKTAPTVQLCNYSGRAIIRCTLVTTNEDKRIPHAHRLVKRELHTDCDEPHDIEVSRQNNFTAAFHGMGIIHTARKHVKDELIRKMKAQKLEELRAKNVDATLKLRTEAELKNEADIYQKDLNLNSVALCFKAFTVDANNVLKPLTLPVYSHPINNLKSALTGELKICRIDKYTSSCEGGEEVFILVEKVGKKNIRIKFFELNEDENEIWTAYGRFSQLDVHHQYAIVFRTPPYKDLNITTPKEVFIQLERPSDSDCSEPIKFTYKPSDRILGRKRPRMSYSNSTELIQTTPLSNISLNDPCIKSFDSRELSNELKQMLLGGCSSTELKEYLNTVDPAEITEYVHLCVNSEEGILVTDGPSVKRDNVNFAKNIVMEAINIIKLEPSDSNEAAPNYNKKERLKKLLMNRSTYGDTPLHAALRHGQRDFAKYILILIGTDPDYRMIANIQNSSGKTPLHYAVLQNQPDITKALLVIGADPNLCDDHGFSPLHAAVRIPEAGMCVDVLLSYKDINIEAFNDIGWTPLLLAAEAGSYDAVCSLIKAGANPNNTDKSYGRTALHIAVEGGHKEIVEYLLKKSKIDVNKTNFSGNTALHIAVAYSDTKTQELFCKLLMQHGADPHIQNHAKNIENVDRKRDKVVNDIKMEVDSEEEEEEEEEDTEMTFGQSSFDLASNKPEILRLLTSHVGNAQDENEIMLPVKLEVLNVESRCDWLTEENKVELSTVLDKTKGWEQLARRLDLEYLLDTFNEDVTSPSLLLLNYIDVQGNVSIGQMQEVLNELHETEAVVVVNEIMKRLQ